MMTIRFVYYITLRTSTSIRILWLDRLGVCDILRLPRLVYLEYRKSQSDYLKVIELKPFFSYFSQTFMLAKNPFQISHMLVPSKSARSTQHINQLVQLSDSDSDEELNGKIRDVQMIQNIPDGIELSDDEIFDTRRVKIPSPRPRKASKIPHRILSQKTSDFGQDDLKKVMASIMNDNKSKDGEIKRLRKELSIHAKMEEAEPGENDGDLRNVRIKELSRKSRRLTVAYEKERSMVAQLETKLKQLEEVKNPNIFDPELTDETLLKNRAELKGHKDKLSLVTRKLEDERLQSQTMKQEIRNLHKILAQEVGDGYNIEKVRLSLHSCQLLKGESNAKGRIEQIALLKDKVTDLKRKLQAFSGSVTESTRKTPDAIHGKRKEIEALSKQIEDSRKDQLEMKKKNDALNARLR
jgi:hypothetical protein